MQDNIGKSYKSVLGDEYSSITLEGALPDPLRGQNCDDWIVKGARVSYRGKPRTKEEDAGLIRRLLTHKHESPFEQPHLTYSLRAPMAVVVHLLRHRTFHVNGESSRFKQPKDEFYIPKKWRVQSTTNKQTSEGEVDTSVNDLLTMSLDTHIRQSYELYQAAVNSGVGREQARLFLPTDANYRSYVITCDLRNLINFWSLRCASDAQEETRNYACASFWLARPLAPITLGVWAEEVAKPEVLENLVVWKSINGDPVAASED